MFSVGVIGYLFLGGTGAGACAVLSVMTLLVPCETEAEKMLSSSRRSRITVVAPSAPYRRLFAPGFLAALGALAVGCILLVGDLGVTNRAVLLFTSPTPSFLTLGSYALVALMVLALLLAVAWGLPSAHMRWGLVRGLAVAGLVVGVVVATYTGLLLFSVQAVPFWRTPWLPALFVASALSSGIALVVATACFTGAFPIFATVMGGLARTDAIVVVLELACAVAFMASAFVNSYDVARAGANLLVQGSLSTVFWGGFAFLGLALPFVLDIAVGHMDASGGTRGFGRVGAVGTRGFGCASASGGARALPVALISACSVLVGSAALRYCIVMAGSHPEVWTVIL